MIQSTIYLKFQTARSMVNLTFALVEGSNAQVVCEAYLPESLVRYAWYITDPPSPAQYGHRMEIDVAESFFPGDRLEAFRMTAPLHGMVHHPNEAGERCA